MGLFDVDEEKIKILYHRAWIECNRGVVNPRKHDYLNKALLQFCKENNCSYDDAFVLAKTGKRTGRLAGK